jgi:hypothetical protein
MLALAIFDAVGNGEEEIFPDPTSAPLAALWRDGAAKLVVGWRAVERRIGVAGPAEKRS